MLSRVRLIGTGTILGTAIWSWALLTSRRGPVFDVLGIAIGLGVGWLGRCASSRSSR